MVMNFSWKLFYDFCSVLFDEMLMFRDQIIYWNLNMWRDLWHRDTHTLNMMRDGSLDKSDEMSQLCLVWLAKAKEKHISIFICGCSSFVDAHTPFSTSTLWKNNRRKIKALKLSLLLIQFLSPRSLLTVLLIFSFNKWKNLFFNERSKEKNVFCSDCFMSGF